MKLVDLLQIGYNLDDWNNIKNEIAYDYKLPEDIVSSDSDFINWLGLAKQIYVQNDTVVPFNHIKTTKEDYVFYINTDINTNLINSLGHKLAAIDYDLSKLTVRTNGEVVNGVLANAPYFVINNNYYN